MLLKETVVFLVENRERNDKQWFQAHKDTYRQCVLEQQEMLIEMV